MVEPAGRSPGSSEVYRRPHNWRRWLPERIIGFFLLLCAAASILTTIGIVSVLIFEAASFFSQVSIFEFLGGTR